MEFKLRGRRVDILVNVVNALRVERRRPTLDTVNLIALLKKKLGKVASVLPCDARN